MTKKIEHLKPEEVLDCRPQPAFNSYTPEEQAVIQSHMIGMKIYSPQMAEIDGYNIESLDVAYKEKKVNASYRRHLLDRLRAMQKELDRKAKRK